MKLPNNFGEHLDNNPSFLQKLSNAKKKDISDSESESESESDSSNESEKEEEKSYSSSSSNNSNKNNSNENMNESGFESLSEKEIIEIKIKEKEIPTSKNDDKKFLKDKKENEDNQITEKLIKEISDNLKSSKGLLEKEMEEIKTYKDFFDKKNFILTDLSCKRMAEIIHYIKSGNPVLLEGDTGTAKTRTSVIACEYLMEYSNENLNENTNKICR